MYQTTRKCLATRFHLFKWCRDYKSKHNLVWEDRLTKCGEIQECLPNEDTGKLDQLVRNQQLKKVQIQFQFWKQPAKGKRLVWEDTNTK